MNWPLDNSVTDISFSQDGLIVSFGMDKTKVAYLGLQRNQSQKHWTCLQRNRTLSDTNVHLIVRARLHLDGHAGACKIWVPYGQKR